MELLVDWIGPRISQALADALEWKSRDAPVAADGDAKFLDDGNSIHIKSVKKEFAQIIKVGSLQCVPGSILNRHLD